MSTKSFVHLSKMKIFMFILFFAPLFFSGAVSGRHNFFNYPSKTAPSTSQEEYCYCPCACTDNTYSPTVSPPATPRASELYNFTASDLCNTTSVSLGASRFRNEVGIDFMIGAMEEALDFIFVVFEQENITDRKHGVMTKIHLYVHDILEGAVGYYNWDFSTDTQVIHINAAFITETIPPEDVKDRVKALIFHEMTHAWQWYGDESSPNPPASLFEGIADYMPMTAGLATWGVLPEPGIGGRWDEGYEVTALFLTYCNTLRPGFVAALNKMMKYNYSDNYFEELLGKPVQELWRDYKNKYGHTDYVRTDVRL